MWGYGKMEWKSDIKNTAPKTGEEILRYNPLQNVLCLINWNRIYKHWSSKGQWKYINKEDLWLKIPEVTK